MKNVIGFLVVIQLVVATVAFAAESESDCTDGVQAARNTSGDGTNAAPTVTPPTAPVSER
ncbi:MAG: hypothetical protein HYV97_14580 [Bdellovibrio sp.]|nr:hypothetical protein [Bdellovibrio sp.]